uniref:Uncharacterized protein n=1 Tax=viral metagenome TaxID=1070528 RepID=A0A6M3LHY8_9ZZZZ
MCVHYEVITTPSPGGHMIGRCKRCGMETDYTELQKGIPILACESLLEGGVTMETIMAHETGRTKRMMKLKALQKVGSRGRVR